jgi:uncharacterized RmlC-like cupin family protein
MATTQNAKEILVLHPPETQLAKQEIPQFFGVSRESVGATGLSLNVTAFPPGGKSNTHMHRDYETAIYGVEGDIALFYGERLENVVTAGKGDFIFIPSYLPHKAYNLSTSRPATFITARNDADEQENVIVTPEADDGSAEERVRELMLD